MKIPLALNNTAPTVVEADNEIVQQLMAMGMYVCMYVYACTSAQLYPNLSDRLQ